MTYRKLIKNSKETIELDAFAFLSEVGKYVDSVAGIGADEATIYTLILRAQEQASTEEGLDCGEHILFMREDQ